MKKMGSTLILVLILAAIIVGGTILGKHESTIGEFSGDQNQCLTIDGRDYAPDANPPVNRGDKDRFLGKVKSGDKIVRIYSMKDTDDYLYCRWGWKGQVYKAADAS